MIKLPLSAIRKESLQGPVDVDAESVRYALGKALVCSLGGAVKAVEDPGDGLFLIATKGRAWRAKLDYTGLGLGPMDVEIEVKAEPGPIQVKLCWRGARLMNLTQDPAYAIYEMVSDAAQSVGRLAFVIPAGMRPMKLSSVFVVDGVAVLLDPVRTEAPCEIVLGAGKGAGKVAVVWMDSRLKVSSPRGERIQSVGEMSEDSPTSRWLQAEVDKG